MQRSHERPLIAVSTSEARRASVSAAIGQADPPQREMVLGLRYLEAIEAAGGIPMVVPPLNPAAIDSLLGRVAGVCLSGGPDILPSAYGAEPHPQLGPTEPDLDDFELAFAAAAREREIPLLGICRGAQLVNVACGGTLHQHLPDVVGQEIGHRQQSPAQIATHSVELSPESMLACVIGDRPLEVNSFHHQAADRLGSGLVATAFAPDGTVEAFESTDGGFLLAVQWHAESLTADPRQAALFDALVEASVEEMISAGSGLLSTVSP